MRQALIPVVTYFWLPVALVILWWVGSENSSSFFFPPLSDALARLAADLLSGALLRDTWVSLRNVAVGLSIAIVLGIGLGLLIGQKRTLREAVWPTLSFLRAIPAVAIVPIVIVAFGIGAGPKIFVIASTVVFPILLNTIDGVRGIRESIVDTARAYRIPRRVYVRQVMLSAAMPQIMAGIRISLSVSLTLMVVSEFASGNEGLGYYILSGTERFDMAQVWAGTIYIGLIGYLVNVAFVLVEHRILGWYFGVPSRVRSRTGSAPTGNKKA